jgi:acyl-CoA thioester hydrolase
MEAEGFSLPVIEAHCEYRQPARYDDELEIRTEAALISPARVAFKYDVVRAGDAQPLVTGHTVHATIDRDGRPCRIPARVKGLFA